ncbi:MAG: DUF6686 family protein [Bacteroidota bacterium]
MTPSVNPDHEQTILYESQKGFVVYCYCCKTFHIAYGTVALDLTETSLLSLINVLVAYYQDYKDKVDPRCRCIQVLTPFNGIRLLFSLPELKELANILSEAHLILNSERIVNSIPQ